ncbi:hypothetical protein [Arthrospiribacter ruber]|uniref:Uncharacterized protein n=1 Tax=Arthrospiribacter ruber TaxID=2487934 RepID=A0A951J118_9BACT|nr:hypothetical protein [Arthrospiribacter ruber]MBW3469516.1 hypothetical protein [Arthrospiribacter ruber]
MNKTTLFEPLMFGRISIFIYVVGLYLSLNSGSVLGSVLFMDYGVPVDQSKQIEKTIAAIFLILGFISLMPKIWYGIPLVGIGAFILAYLTQDFGGGFFTKWSLISHSPRYLLPFGLVFLTFENTKKVGIQLFRVGVVLVFFIHGLESLQSHPYFAEYILNSFEYVGIPVHEDQALLMMKIIGGIDILVAALVLFSPSVFIYAWASFWVLITFVIRFLSFGWLMHKEVLLRWPNLVLPLILLSIMLIEGKKKNNESVFQT